MFKTFLVYIHLIAACLAVGVLLMQDLALAKWRGRAMDAEARANLHQNAGIVTLALVVLWVSGLAIVIIGYLDNPGAGRTEQLFVLVTAVVSLVSWLYSCYLGIARPWNNVAPYSYVMTIYVMVMAVAMAVGLAVWRELRNEFRLLAH